MESTTGTSRRFELADLQGHNSGQGLRQAGLWGLGPPGYLELPTAPRFSSAGSRGLCPALDPCPGKPRTDRGAVRTQREDASLLFPAPGAEKVLDVMRRSAETGESPCSRGAQKGWWAGVNGMKSGRGSPSSGRLFSTLSSPSSATHPPPAGCPPGQAPSALRPQNSAPEPGALRSRDAAPEAGALMCCFLCVPGPTVQSGRFQASGSVSLSRFTACPPLCVCPASLSVPTSESAPRTPSVLSRRHLLPPRP
ncbi:unnamed protein product [Rangifer tarandus platyrhynchus]|uniref:Uncharacterized protein n=1 Tax=Rangifer tarandus platyrhynchus TaxID=3082113 RepID=A0AC60A2I7_RANTA